MRFYNQTFCVSHDDFLRWCELWRLTMKSINHLRPNVNNNNMDYMQAN